MVFGGRKQRREKYWENFTYHLHMNKINTQRLSILRQLITKLQDQFGTHAIGSKE